MKNKKKMREYKGRFSQWKELLTILTIVKNAILQSLGLHFSKKVLKNLPFYCANSKRKRKTAFSAFLG